jgi:hypothetical protein
MPDEAKLPKDAKKAQVSAVRGEDVKRNESIVLLPKSEHPKRA